MKYFAFFKKKGLLLLAAGFLISACGYKGPLYLPASKTTQQQTGDVHAHAIHKNAGAGK